MNHAGASWPKAVQRLPLCRLARGVRGLTFLLRSCCGSTDVPRSSANLTLAPFGGRGIETAAYGDVMTCVVRLPGAGRNSFSVTASTVPVLLMPVISTLYPPEGFWP